MKTYEELLAERDSLVSQLTDAFGDGYYDGFLDGAKHHEKTDCNTEPTYLGEDALRCSEIAEQAKSKRTGIPSRLDLIAERDALAACIERIRQMAYEKSANMLINYGIDGALCKRLHAMMQDVIPQQCLAEIKAEAGRAGYLEGHLDGLGDPDEIDKEQAAYRAKQYAAKVRQDEQIGTWLKDSNVNGGKRQGGEK